MIIAEHCNNWADINEAKEAIRAAKEAGASLSKFQLYNAEDDKGKPWYDWVKAHELNFTQSKELFDYGASIGQEVFFSVFGPQYVDWCEKIGVKRYKIALNVTDENILSKISFTDKQIIMSFGTNFDRFYYLVDNDVIKLYCPNGYPPNIKHLKLPVFSNRIVQPYDGFSDHSIGLDVAKIALSRGAKYIEKHFCLYDCEEFPDNDWSMDVNELKELVRFDKVCQEVLG